MNLNRRIQTILFSVLLILALLAGPAGCARYVDVEAFRVDMARQSAMQTYTLAPPDVIYIAAPQVPEIDKTKVTISPDGTVFLPLIGVVRVAGQTPAEVACLLEDRSLEYYQEAEVAVQVVQYRSKHVYVFGEVALPGRYAWNGSDTMLDLLSRAQPTRLAESGRIHLFRPGSDGKPTHRMTVDLDEWIKKGQTEQNTLLAEGDIVYVPANALATVGLAVQQLLLPIQPAAGTMRGVTNIDHDADQISTGDSQR